MVLAGVLSMAAMPASESGSGLPGPAHGGWETQLERDLAGLEYG